ncbi:MAG: LysM peptidoglycan-binding domain-containing protein [Flavobacteriaceae bacterium]|nr:LysM peptidoglycan-binding domain-containing protein [Flavobacteriaceae bacterium]
MKKLLVFFVALFASVLVYGQEYKTHTVEIGESIEDIARKYNVTPYNIYKYNPEVRKGLQVGHILVISTEMNLPKDVIKRLKKENNPKEEKEVYVRKPIRFEDYKVRRRDGYMKLERLFGVSESDIKKYNKQLYAEPLKKGMMLRIPVYPKIPENMVVADTVQVTGEIYVVKPQETRWSIAHRYGITVDSLKVLNPEMGEILSIGQELHVPIKTAIPFTTKETMEGDLDFIVYTVPAKENYFQLKQKYQVTEEQLKKHNPQLDSLGLQKGMEIQIPKIVEDTEAISSNNYMFYEIKPKDNFFQLKKKLGYTEPELRALNPIIAERNGLHPGMVLKIPRKQTFRFNVRNSQIVESFNMVDSISPMNHPKVALMLPFKSRDMAYSSPGEVEVQLKKSKPMFYSMGMYTGALVALDSLKNLGVNVDVKVMDTQGDVFAANKLLYERDFNEVQAVIGPLYNSVFAEVAKGLKEKDIPVFAPISSGGKIELDNVFYTMPNSAVCREKIVSYIQSYKKEQELVILVDPAETDELIYLKQRFPNARYLDLDLLKKPFDYIKRKFNPEIENWFLVHTKKASTLGSWVTVLNGLNSDKIKVTLFAYEKDKTFDYINNTSLSKLNFHFASNTKVSATNHPFAIRYKEKFGKAPDKYAARGFDLMMDVVLRLAYKNTIFEACNTVGETTYVESKFNYNKYLYSSYYNEGVYLMKYQNLRIQEVLPQNVELESNN